MAYLTGTLQGTYKPSEEEKIHNLLSEVHKAVEDVAKKHGFLAQIAKFAAGGRATLDIRIMPPKLPPA